MIFDPRPRWHIWHLGLLVALCGIAVIQQEPGLGFGSQTLQTFTNPFTVIYLLLPVHLVVVLRLAGSLVRPATLIRCGSYARWVVHAAGLAFGAALPLTLGLLGAALATGAGSAATGMTDMVEHATILGALPIVTLAIWWAVLTINLGLLGTFVLVVCLLLTQRLWVLPAAAVFGVVPITFASPTPWPVLNVANGLALGASIDQYGSVLVALAAPILVNLLLPIGIAVVLDSRVRGIRLERSGITLAAAVLVIVSAQLTTVEGASGTEAFLAAFFGISPGAVSLPSYLFLAIITTAPAWWALLRFEDRMETLPERLVRHGTARRWYASATARAVATIPAYFIVIAVGSLLLLNASHGAATSTSEPATRVALLHVIGNGSLQAILAVLVTLLCRWVAGATWGGLAGLGAVVAGGFLTQGDPRWPFALNSTAPLLIGQDPLRLTGVLLVWLAALAAATVALTSPRRFALLERNLPA